MLTMFRICEEYNMGHNCLRFFAVKNILAVTNTYLGRMDEQLLKLQK